ncbi:ECF transporter S component [Streptococcus himalayensis]|nr:ECF transporter S component [Streptococcus himalayensis]
MTKTRKMALIAILSALSFLLMFFDFPILPAVPFLRLDFSIVPILLGLLMLDTRSAMTIVLLRSLLKLVLNNQGVSTYIGLPMNMIAMASFVLVFALVWKKQQTIKRFVLASISATLVLTFVMVLLNAIYAIPLYAMFAGFDIAATIGVGTYLWTMVVPFNMIEGLVFALAFWLVQLFLKPVWKQYEA